MNSVPGRGDRLFRYPLYFWLAIVLIVIYAPMALVAIFSFNRARFQVFPLEGFSFKWYQLLISDTSVLDAFRHSLGLATSVSVVSTSLGFLGAYTLVRTNFIGKTLLTSLLVTPIAIPGVLLGLALRIYFFQLGWQFSLGTAFLGHLVVTLPLALFVIRARLLQIPLNLEEAAWMLGAKRWRSLLDVIVPLALPGIVAALLLTFTFSFDEFIMTYFLTQFEITLPVKIWTTLITGFDPTINAIGSIVFITSFGIAVIAQTLLSRRKDDSLTT